MTECCGGDSPPPATCPLQPGCFWGVSSRDKGAQTQPTPPGAPSAPARCAVGTGGAGFAPFAFFLVCVCPSRAFARGSASLFIAGWCLWVVFFFFFLFLCFPACACAVTEAGLLLLAIMGNITHVGALPLPATPGPLSSAAWGRLRASREGAGCVTPTWAPRCCPHHHPEPSRVPASSQDPSGDHRVPAPLPLPRRDPAEGTGTRMGTADVAAAIFEQITRRSTRGCCTE